MDDGDGEGGTTAAGGRYVRGKVDNARARPEE